MRKQTKISKKNKIIYSPSKLHWFSLSFLFPASSPSRISLMSEGTWKASQVLLDPTTSAHLVTHIFPSPSLPSLVPPFPHGNELSPSAVSPSLTSRLNDGGLDNAAECRKKILLLLCWIDWLVNWLIDGECWFFLLFFFFSFFFFRNNNNGEVLRRERKRKE